MVHAAEDGHDHHIGRFRPEHEIGEDAPVENPEQSTREAGKATGDREGGQLIEAHIDPDKSGALGVFADRRQHPAKRRAGQSAQCRHAQRHQHQRQHVELFGDPHAVEAGERGHPAEIGERHVGQSLIAAGQIVPLEADGPDDLGKCQGQHGEVDLGQPHAEKSEAGGKQCRDQPGRWKGEPERHRHDLHQDAAGIGADAEIGGMPERHQPGRAEQQVQAQREQRVDRDLGAEEGVIARPDPGQRQSHEKDDQGPRHLPAGARRHPHGALRPLAHDPLIASAGPRGPMGARSG